MPRRTAQRSALSVGRVACLDTLRVIPVGVGRVASAVDPARPTWAGPGVGGSGLPGRDRRVLK